MPRAPKNHEALNLRIDADLNHRLTAICAEAGQTKTAVVERAPAAYFEDYDHKQRILRQAEAGLLLPVEDAE